MGVFVFEMDFLRTLSADTLPRTLYDLTASMLGHGVPVHAYGFDGFWEDLDDLATYYRTSMALLTPEPALVLDDPVWPVQTRGEERPPARFLPGSSARASLVAGGATVAGEVECSILFGGVVVEPGARVTNSILFQDVRVRQGAVLDRAILDKQVEVGEGAVVGDGPRPADDVAGLCVVGKEASLAPGYRVPRGGVVPVAAGALAGARA